MSDHLELKMKDDSLNNLPGVSEWLKEVARIIEEKMLSDFDTPNEPLKLAPSNYKERLAFCQRQDKLRAMTMEGKGV